MATKQELTTLFEKFVENYREESLHHDFRYMYVSKKDWGRVIEKVGEYCLMDSCSFYDYHIKWYLYHSPIKAQCYIVWLNEVTGRGGCRIDIDRISVLENIGHLLQGDCIDFNLIAVDN
jgi:hypothetical protein